MNNFDRIAPLYDFLTRVIFGKSIMRSQTYFFNCIRPNSKILIIGGGTGKVLNHLDSLAIPLSVTYIERSQVMLEKSEMHEPFLNLQVEFILGNETSIPVQKYDLVLTAFFLDVFKENHLTKVVKILSEVLEPKGQWVVTDFMKTSVIWQRILVRLMYFFFRITTGLEGDKLLDFKTYLNDLGFTSIQEKAFYHNMIKSTVYQRTDNTSG